MAEADPAQEISVCSAENPLSFVVDFSPSTCPWAFLLNMNSAVGKGSEKSQHGSECTVREEWSSSLCEGNPLYPPDRATGHKQGAELTRRLQRNVCAYLFPCPTGAERSWEGAVEGGG